MNWFEYDVSDSSGYSPRLFVIGECDKRFDGNLEPTKIESAHQYLKEQCIWHGHDKVWNSKMGEWWGYEIRREKFATCLAIVKDLLGEPIDQSVALR